MTVTCSRSIGHLLNYLRYMLLRISYLLEDNIAESTLAINDYNLNALKYIKNLVPLVTVERRRNGSICAILTRTDAYYKLESYQHSVLNATIFGFCTSQYWNPRTGLQDPNVSCSCVPDHICTRKTSYIEHLIDSYKTCIVFIKFNTPLSTTLGTHTNQIIK